MEGAAYPHDQGFEADTDLQALDHAARQTDDVVALFDVLKGKLRPGRSTEAEGGETAKTSRGRSILQAHYDGSAGNIVLSTANIRRIHDFLSEPQKHLGQVIADIEKEVGDIYSQGGSLRHSHRTRNNYQMQRERGGNYAATTLKNDKRVCLEEIPEMNKYLGPRSRFGDGDGSFWDRWLTTTGHFAEDGAYAKADIPTRSMYSKGAVIPKSGFKRYRLDKLAFPRNPDPRVLTYAQRRELGEAFRHRGKPKRLHGASTEQSFSPTVDEWLDEVVATNTGEDFKTAVESKERLRGAINSDRRRSWTLDPTHGGSREDCINYRRSNSWSVVMKVEAERDEAADAAPEPREGTFGGDKMKQAIQDGEIERDSRSAEEEDNALDQIYPKYFGKQARTQLHDHFKQIVRRRHRYEKKHPGDSPSLPSSADHVEVVPASKMAAHALIPDIQEIEPDLQPDTPEEVQRGMDGTGGRAGSTRGATRVLPPLATLGMPTYDNAAGAQEGCGGQDEGDAMTLLNFAGGSQVTSRTRFVLRCAEENAPPRADILIRKSHTTKVNLAHQGMGDVMGRILADSLDGLPLMRELNLRDNRLTDKGLMPIIKAIKQRRDLYALDLSENKLDRWAARQLALYFSDPRITLAKFVLSKADVDDFEASNFVKKMRNNTTLTYLDMSHNLIGSQESFNYVRPEFYTGAEALADWVSTESCPLKYLDVSWNTIRLDSAVYFGNALARASHLEELDLSFNCFGNKGGEAIGASLHINTCLKKLGLASNAIDPRACFVIGQGLLCNSSIQSINLSNNAIGKVGVGWVVALTAEVKDRIDIQLANCNFVMECKDCWFDDDELKSSYQLRTDEPYDRAVAVHLIRRAARDEGLKLKLVSYRSPGEAEKEIKLTRTVARSKRPFPERAFLEEIFSKYDKDGRGSLSRDDLQGALSELNLGGSMQVERVMARHANISGLVEKEYFNSFVQTSVLQSKKRDERCKGFMAEESKPGTRWIVPWDAQLHLKLEYTRLHNQVYHTSLEDTDGFVSMLMRIGDGATEVMTHILDHVSLEMEQGIKLYSAVLRHLGGDKVKAVAKVIPRMEFLDDARLLKNMILRDVSERRKLRHEFGPAYRPLMGTPMGHYELDLAKPMHRLAVRKIMECSNLEKLQRQAERPLVFDVSQDGDWANIRNGTVNGRPSRIKDNILETPHRAGMLTMDYVSTTRRPVKFEQGCKCHPAAMNAKGFHEMLRLVGILEDTEGAMDTAEEAFDQAIDEALSKFPPRPKSPTMFQYLHFAFTGERSDGSKAPTPLRPSALEKLKNLSGRKQSSMQSELGSGTLNILRLAQRDDRHPTKESTRDTESRPTRGGNAGSLKTMSYRLDDVMADRWFSIRQCRFVLLALEEIFSDEDLLQDAIADFVVTVYPRIVDIHDYMTLVGCVADSTAAFVIKRVGWLAAWNPCQPDGLFELTLDRRDDRQMVKMLVHLFVEEGSESWASSTFRWEICDSPVPNWVLPVGWYTIEGMPSKGILKVEFRSEPTVNWSLRVALARTVTLCDILPREVLRIVDSECRTQDEAPRSASKSVTVDKRNLQKGGGEESGLYPDLKSLERPFDTNFVNALCRKVGNTFFLY